MFLEDFSALKTLIVIQLDSCNSLFSCVRTTQKVRMVNAEQGLSQREVVGLGGRVLRMGRGTESEAGTS